MKKLMLIALAALPFLGIPMMAKPAAADVIINLPLSNRRPVLRDRKTVYPIRTWKNQRPAQVRKNRRVRQRRRWIAGQWRDRSNNGRTRRVWVPGHYVIR